MTLNRGEVVSLLGPSGSGKTTLLRAVAGLEVPHQGTITIGDKIVFDGAAQDRHSRRRPQPRPRVPVVRAVAAQDGLRQRRLRTEAAQDRRPPTSATRVKAALEQLSLGHLAERFPHQLSGGQQQRVALARALVYNPPVILLDEPLSNLDAKLREEARAWLRELIVRHAALGAVRDARPGRGARDVRPHPAAQRRQDRAAGHAAGDVQRPRIALHRRLHGQQQPADRQVAEVRDGVGAARRRRLEAVGRRDGQAPGRAPTAPR